jgi:hypothetical protein
VRENRAVFWGHDNLFLAGLIGMMSLELSNSLAKTTTLHKRESDNL